MSDTPRTDAADGAYDEHGNLTEVYEVSCQLERELAATMKQIDQLSVSLQEMTEDRDEVVRVSREQLAAATARAEKAEAAEAYWKTRWASEVDELRRQLGKTTCRDCGAGGPLIAGLCAGCSDASESKPEGGAA